MSIVARTLRIQQTAGPVERSAGVLTSSGRAWLASYRLAIRLGFDENTAQRQARAAAQYARTGRGQP